MPVATIKHQCKPHEFQDTKYGPSKRVMNETKKNTLRCTICGKEQPK